MMFLFLNAHSICLAECSTMLSVSLFFMAWRCFFVYFYLLIIEVSDRDVEKVANDRNEKK